MDRTPNACQHSALLRGACVGRFARIPALPSPILSGLGVALALALLATGCTTGPGEWIRNGFKVGPNYCRPPAPVADQWIDSEDPLVQPQAADYSYWWGVFDDPVLNELVEAAYEQNLPLKVAGMRILEARSQLGVATGNLFRLNPYAAYAEAWAFTFFLVETEPQKYVRYLKRTASRPPFKDYTPAERTADFTAVFGDNWAMLEARFLRYMARVE